MLNEHPRQQLQVIVTRFGHSICDNPKRCEAMLRDLCPEHKREVNLLVAALKEKIAHDLLNRSALMPLEATLKSLSQRLQDNNGTDEQFADWAVESLALSLNVIQNPLPKQAVKSVTNNSSTQKAVSSNPQQQRIGKFIVQDGIATDTTTSLMWLRFAYGQNWENDTAKNGARQIIWKEAFESVAKQFNEHGGYAGYTDWRLPTTKELKTLIDIIKGNADYCIDTDVFPNSPKWFWSSSPNPGNSYDCWFVYIGNSNGSYPDHRFDIRCAVRLVRGGQ